MTTRVQGPFTVALPGGEVGFMDVHGLEFGPSGRLYLTGPVYQGDRSHYVGNYVGFTDQNGVITAKALLPFDGSGAGNDMLAVSDDGRAYIAQGGGSSLYAVTLDGSESEQSSESYHVENGRLVYTIGFGPDGSVYTFARDASQNLSLVVIDSANGATEIPSVPDPGSATVAVAPNGRAYYLAGFGRGSLVVADPENSSVAIEGIDTLGKPLQPWAVAVGDDRRIYITAQRQSNGEGTELIVLNPDYSVDAIVPLGPAALPYHVVVGADGNVFVQTTTGIAVVNSDDYSISATTLPGDNSWTTGLRARGDGVYRWSFNQSDGTVVYFASRIAVPGAAPLPNGAGDDAISTTDAPQSLRGLWNVVREQVTDHGNGVMVQTVRGQDGKNRLIVYLGGTTTDVWDGDQAKAENILALAGVLKPDQVQAINQAVTACAQECPITEIMLVGYSQGGMDAQNLAAPNPLDLVGWDPSLVTTVITFGSPITKLPTPGTRSCTCRTTST